MKKHLLPLIAIAAAIGLSSAQAVPLILNGADGSNLITNGGALSVGTIINGVQGQFGGQAIRDQYMVNNLVSVALNTYTSSFGDGAEYHRTLSGPASLPVATVTSAIATSAGGLALGANNFGACVSLTLGSVFQYLVVAYDGPNGGVIVYNISSLAVGTVIEMPRYARPDGPSGSNAQLIQNSEQYGMTGWTLLRAGAPTQQVPDGGNAIALLGMALLGIEGLRRKLRVS